MRRIFLQTPNTHTEDFQPAPRLACRLRTAQTKVRCAARKSMEAHSELCVSWLFCSTTAFKQMRMRKRVQLTRSQLDPTPAQRRALHVITPDISFPLLLATVFSPPMICQFKLSKTTCGLIAISVMTVHVVVSLQNLNFPFILLSDPSSSPLSDRTFCKSVSTTFKIFLIAFCFCLRFLTCYFLLSSYFQFKTILILSSAHSQEMVTSVLI